MTDSPRQGKSPNKQNHLELTPDEVLENWRLGFYTPQGYLYHLLLSLKKAGWTHCIKSVKAFCDRWEIPRSTFYRAKAKLIDSELLEENILGTLYLTVEKVSISETPVPDPRFSVSDLGSPVSDLRHRVSEMDTQGSESQSLQAFAESPRSYSDLSSDLSQNLPTQPSEREEKILPEFKEWLNRKASQLPTPPTLREQWIQKQAQVEANQEEFRKWRKGQELENTTDFLQTEKIEVEPETLEQRLERYQKQWNTPVLHKGIKAAISTHPEWNMEIGPEGPQWVETPSQAPYAVIVATDCQIAKLGLSEKALGEHLHQWFAKKTRSQLTDEQHYDLLQRLRQLEVAV